MVLLDRADQSSSTPDWLFDIDRRVMIDANPAAAAFWGAASREELLRRGFAEAVDSAGHHLHDMIGRLHQGQSVEGLWTFYPCGEARMVRCRCRPARLGDGRTAVRVTILPTLVPAAADIDTEARRWSEAACHAPFLVSLFTVAGICLMRNPAAARGLEGVHGLFDHVADPVEAARLRARMADGEEVIATVPVNTTGGAAWHEIHARQVRDPASGEAMVLVHEIDVTARRQAEDERDAARLEVEVAGRVRSEFLSMVNHEIRTPMNGVLGALELLDDSTLDAEQRDHLQVARQSAQGLSDQIDGLLDLARLKAGKDRIEEREFDPASLLEEVVRALLPRTLPKRLWLDAAVDPAVPALVHGDADRLRRILLHLADNAIKFTETGGITLRIGATAVGGRQAVLCLEVADTGIGIPPDGRSTLFEDFAKGDASLGRRHGGAGLGLALSRQLVRLLGGRLDVASTPGEGSAFWFEVPVGVRRTRDGSSESSAESVDDAAAQALRINHLTAWASERHDRILVVDDSPTNRMVAAAMLRKAGFEVLLASGGEEAVALAADTPVDLILMDIAMPGMDGLAAAGAIRALPGAAAQVPIVAMTANGLTEDRARCRAAGMDDYLLKPFQKIDLLEVIARQRTEDERQRTEDGRSEA